MRFKQIPLFFTSSIFFAANAIAQDFPSKPVHIIIPFTAGSATDFVGCTLGQELSKMWGHPVVFENHAGAGLAAKASADGQTLLISAAYVASPALYKKLPHDPVEDFVNITPLARQPMVRIA